jgi:hypothetical protein
MIEDRESEIMLLRFFGPNVPLEILERISGAFCELRKLVDEGVLAYPYSTRECVNIVKHLQSFPSDDVNEALENIFSFDYLDDSAKKHIVEVFNRNRIRLKNFNVYERRERQKKKPPLEITYNPRKPPPVHLTSFAVPLILLQIGAPKHGKVDPMNVPHVGGNTWAGGTGGSTTAGLVEILLCDRMTYR